MHINDNLEYGTCYGRYIMKYTGSKALLPPEFISPINYWDNPLDFSIEWIPIIGANNYHLQVVEREQNFNKEYFDSTFFINDSLINGTSLKLTNTKYNKEYACRIRAMNSTQKSGWIEGYWVTVQDTTSVFDINSIEKNTIIPNPVSDYIELNNEFSNDNSIIKIYNLYGTKLFELPYSNKIDIRSMPCGVYFLEINKSFLKFIKF